MKRLLILFLAILSFAMLPVAVTAQGVLLTSESTKVENKIVMKKHELTIGGVTQTVLTSGNPNGKVIIFVHGGPGTPLWPFAPFFQEPLEKDFFIVHYDQRGAGLSRAARQPASELKVSRFVSDLDEVVSWAKSQTNKQKVYIFGHSWGSYLGVLYADKHPDNVAGLITSGQYVGVEQSGVFGANPLGGLVYHPLKGLIKLLAVGPSKALATIKSQALFDTFVEKNLVYDIGSGYNLDHISSLSVPFYLLQGKHDGVTPAKTAESFYNRLKADKKELVWFEESAHLPFFEEPAKFASELKRIVDKAD